MALVYTTQEDAQAAAALFPRRFEQFKSFFFKRTWSDVLVSGGMTSVETSVKAISANRYVMVLTLHAPLPTTTVHPDTNQPPMMSAIYQTLVRGYTALDLAWLQTHFV